MSTVAPGRRARHPLLVVLVACAVAVPVGVAAVRGEGFAPARVAMSGGVAWLASPDRALVTLVDGPSELVLGSVRAGAGRVDRVVQVGSSALLVDSGAGTVTRVDGGTYDVSAPVRFAAGGPLHVLTGTSATYVIDGRATAAAVDPVSLGVLREEPLSGVPGAGQAVVDGADRLWVLAGATGGLLGFGGTAEPARSDVGDAGSRLVVVGGRPAVIDAAQRRAGWIGDDAQVDRWACFPDAAPDGMRVLGSAGSSLLYAAVPGSGSLVVSDLESGQCAAPVPVGRPGEVLGPLVESAGFVLVPNESTGRVSVVDVGAGAVAADLQVLPDPVGRLELVARDGLVFYNDLAGDRAGVLQLAGARWSVGGVQRKYVLGADEGLLEPGSGAIPPDRPPQGVPAPRAVPEPGPGAPLPVTETPPTPTPTVTVPVTTTSTVPPDSVVTPDVAFAVGRPFDKVSGSIDGAIVQACDDGTVCLDARTVVGPDLIDRSLRPCVVIGAPEAGRTVPRGSALVFTVDRPCGQVPSCPGDAVPSATCAPVTTTTTTPPDRPELPGESSAVNPDEQEVQPAGWTAASVPSLPVSP